MAESADDKAVDECIADLEDVVKRLKAEQSKDVEDEDDEETPPSKQPKNLKDAERQGRNAIRRGRGEKVRDDSDD